MRQSSDVPRRDLPETGKKGSMTVSEAGHKGGQKVRDLIQKGEQMEEKGKR